MGVRAVVFRCIAGGVSPECTHICGRQPWGSGLMLAACVGPEHLQGQRWGEGTRMNSEGKSL